MTGSNETKIDHLKTDESHIKNALTKITDLLEDIREQKAFVFTFKNLLIVFILFAIFLFFSYFTATVTLCEKGQQVRIGYLRQLQASANTPPSSPPLISRIFKLFNLNSPAPQYILIRNNEDVIQISTSATADISAFLNYRVVATGDYNTCSNTLTIDDPNRLEIYSGN